MEDRKESLWIEGWRKYGIVDKAETILTRVEKSFKSHKTNLITRVNTCIYIRPPWIVPRKMGYIIELCKWSYFFSLLWFHQYSWSMHFVETLSLFFFYNQKFHFFDQIKTWFDITAKKCGKLEFQQLKNVIIKGIIIIGMKDKY